MNHEEIIRQQMMDQEIVEEAELGPLHDDEEDIELMDFSQEMYYDYGEEKIETGRRSSFKATKLA